MMWQTNFPKLLPQFLTRSQWLIRINLTKARFQEFSISRRVSTSIEVFLFSKEARVRKTSLASHLMTTNLPLERLTTWCLTRWTFLPLLIIVNSWTELQILLKGTLSSLSKSLKGLPPLMGKSITIRKERQLPKLKLLSALLTHQPENLQRKQKKKVETSSCKSQPFLPCIPTLLEKEMRSHTSQKISKKTLKR